MRPESGGGSGSAGLAPFDKYPASPGAIEKEAAALAKQANTTLDEKDATDRAFTPALQNWDGMCAPELQNAPEPVRRSAYAVSTNLAWAAIPLRYWADRVRDFNAKVDEITSNLESKGPRYGAKGEGGKPPSDDAIAEARTEAESAARTAWYQAHATFIQDGAQTASAMFRNGPTAQHLAQAASVGVITATPWNRAMIRGAIPRLSRAEGERLGQMLRRNIESGPNPKGDPNAYGVADLLALLHAEKTAHGPNYKFPPDRMDFLQGLYAGLGTAAVKLPQYLSKTPRYRHTYISAPGTDMSGQLERDRQMYAREADTARRAFGNGLLMLSNEDLGGGWDKVPQSIKDTIKDLPRVEKEHIPDPTGYTAGRTIYKVEGGESFLGLSQLLRGSEETGGDTFSREVTVSVSELAERMDQIDREKYEWDHGNLFKHYAPESFTDYTDRRGGLDNAMEGLLDVSTRNRDANYEILTGKDAETGQQLKGTDGKPLIDSRQTLVNLYKYNWNDDGESAAKLTSWIADDAREAHAHGKEDPRATEAAARYIDIVTETPEGEGRTNGLNTFAELSGQLRENPEIARGMARVASNYLHDFSDPLGAKETTVKDGHLDLSDHDATRFVTLIGTDAKASHALSTASGFYQQHMLDNALSGERDPLLDRQVSVSEVAQRSSRLDGLLVGGRVNAEMMADTKSDGDRMQAWREHMMYVGVGKGLGQTALGAIPVVGPYVSAGAGAVTDIVVFDKYPIPTPQADYDPGDIKTQGRDDVTVAHNYLKGLVNSQKVSVDDIRQLDPTLVDGDHVKGPGELGNRKTSSLIDVANKLGSDARMGEESGFDEYQQNYDAKQRYDDVSYETSAEIPGFTRGKN